MRVRIWLSQAPKEIDIDVEDADAVVATIEDGMKDGGGVVWITDGEGHRHGVVASKVVYIQMETAKQKSVGFSS